MSQNFLEGAVEIARAEYVQERARQEAEKSALKAEIETLNAERTKVSRALSQERAAFEAASRDRAQLAAEVVTLKEQAQVLKPLVDGLWAEARGYVEDQERHLQNLKQRLDRIEIK
jgi:chromosome segregation ATPase